MSTQEGLLAELPRPAGRVLFAGAEGARRLLVDELGADFVALYRTTPLVPDEAPEGDLAVVASPSAARALAAVARGNPGRLDRPRDDAPPRKAAGLGFSPRRGRRTSTGSFGQWPKPGSLRAVFITFLSDFGLQDDFVGTCHGVIKRIAPDAKVIDITHGIEPQAVLQGALVLANTLPYMPEGVHLAVVDPGVGSDRRGLALRDTGGRLYVGPDNGLLVPAAEKLGGVDGRLGADERGYMLKPVSRTFHGRDVFSPAAAHLASGVDPAELGAAGRAADRSSASSCRSRRSARR